MPSTNKTDLRSSVKYSTVLLSSSVCLSNCMHSVCLHRICRHCHSDLTLRKSQLVVLAEISVQFIVKNRAKKIPKGAPKSGLV